MLKKEKQDVLNGEMEMQRIHERLEQALMEVMQDNWDAKQL